MFLATASILFSLWVILSGKFDAFHLTMGVLASLFVAFVSHDLWFRDRDFTFFNRIGHVVRFPAYLAWLVYQITMANLYVMYLAFHPRVKENLDPRIIRFKTILKNDFSKFIFATSITLTPGTVTIRVEGDEFVVHAITSKMAKSLPGNMEKRIARVFEGGKAQ